MALDDYDTWTDLPDRMYWQSVTVQPTAKSEVIVEWWVNHLSSIRYLMRGYHVEEGSKEVHYTPII